MLIILGYFRQMRATTATHAGCVRHGTGHNTPFKVRQQKCCRRWPTTQHTPAEHRGTNCKKDFHHWAASHENKAFIIVLQEIHCTTADKLTIPNFSLAGSIMSRNHGLAMFFHERLEWSLVNQSPDESETEWLCIDVAGYTIINICKPPHLRSTPMAIPTFPHPSLYVGDFNCQHVNWGCNETSPDGESLDSWATSNNLGLLY